jgi:hypothetical protein
MRAKYETLDEYLDDLDAIKEEVAEETKGMNAKQVKRYFAQAARALEQETGVKLRLRRPDHKVSTARR